LVARVFAQLSPSAVSLLSTVAAQRWSRQKDLLSAIEELGIRSIALSAPAGTDVEGELFTFGGAVTSNAELELALRSKLADPAQKAALVDRLLAGKASARPRRSCGSSCSSRVVAPSARPSASPPGSWRTSRDTRSRR
jgi:hypothetical protein